MSDGFFVGGQPEALLAASSALYEAATRTDDVGRALAGALLGASTTILATAPFAPGRTLAVRRAVEDVLVHPSAGLGTVAAAYGAAALQLRAAAQALEAAGVVGLLGSGTLGLLRGERPTVLASADGIDLRREVLTGGVSLGPLAQTSSLAVREVRRPDGSTFFVVELTTLPEVARSAGIQVNGLGAYAETSAGPATTLRWAVPTRRDAELLLAAASAFLAPVVGRHLVSLPRPTEALAAVGASAGFVAGPPVGGHASAAAAVRHEVTGLRSGGRRFSTSISGGGQLGLGGVGGTGGAGSVKVTVERDPAGVLSKATLSTSTVVERGRHGLPALEAGNRQATLVERDWDLELTPERRAAAGRIATAVASGQVPERRDLDTMAEAAAAAEARERTYDVRHQQASVDVVIPRFEGGAAAALDTAVLRP